MSMRKKRKTKEQEGAGEPAPQERPAGESRRITPVEIQQVEFRRSLRGYNEQEVDQFLDGVTEEMARLYAENKRRREELEFKGTTSLSTGPAAEADAMVRQARGEADRILADARVRAQAIVVAAGTHASLAATGESDLSLTPATAVGRVALQAFLTREKQFLHGMAELIQRHAEAVKEDAQRARDEAVAAGAEVAPAREAVAHEGSEGQGDPERASHLEGADGDSTPEEIIDLTEHDPVRLSDESSPAESRYVSSLETAAPIARSRYASGGEALADLGEDRTVRELFWGED
jgi:cell division initiation protein